MTLYIARVLTQYIVDYVHHRNYMICFKYLLWHSPAGRAFRSNLFAPSPLSKLVTKIIYKFTIIYFNYKIFLSKTIAVKNIRFIFENY